METPGDRRAQLNDLKVRIVDSLAAFPPAAFVLNRHAVLDAIGRIFVESDLFRLARITLGPVEMPQPQVKTGQAPGGTGSQISLPLIAGPRCVGIIWLAPMKSPALDEDETSLLSALAGTLARELSMRFGRRTDRRAAA